MSQVVVSTPTTPQLQLESIKHLDLLHLCRTNHSIYFFNWSQPSKLQKLDLMSGFFKTNIYIKAINIYLKSHRKKEINKQNRVYTPEDKFWVRYPQTHWANLHYIINNQHCGALNLPQCLNKLHYAWYITQTVIKYLLAPPVKQRLNDG